MLLKAGKMEEQEEQEPVERGSCCCFVVVVVRVAMFLFGRTLWSCTSR